MFGGITKGFKKILGNGGGALGGAIGTAFGGPIGGAFGSAIGGALGAPSQGSIDRANRQDWENSWKYTRKGVTLGNDLDLRNQKEMFDYRINQGLSAGMTPYEMYMGPAGGAGGGTTGSGQVLGNQAGAQQLESQRLNQADEIARRENTADRVTDLAKTAMQTEAQKDVAEISAGATLGAAGISAEASRYQADLVNKIQQGQLDLSTRSFEEDTLPRLAAMLELNEYEVKLKIEQIATNTPKFKRAQLLLQMGVDNTTNTLLQKRFGINPANDEEIQALSEEQFRNVLAVFTAAGSTIHREGQGLLSMNPFGTTPEFNLNPLNTPGDPNSTVPTLGSTNSPRYQSGASRRARRKNQ